MMTWYNPLTWGEKVVDNVLDKDEGLLSQVGGWIGNMNLTDEEILKANAMTVDSVQTFVKATLNESTERSKTRRSIAVLWIKLHVAIILMMCLAAPWDATLAEYYYRVATSTMMTTITTAITIFFFGSHGLARLQEKK